MVWIRCHLTRLYFTVATLFVCFLPPRPSVEYGVSLKVIDFTLRVPDILENYTNGQRKFESKIGLSPPGRIWGHVIFIRPFLSLRHDLPLAE